MKQALIKTDHILGHKKHLTKFKKIEMIQHLLSNHSGIKLEITYRKITGKFPKYLEIKQHTSK